MLLLLRSWAKLKVLLEIFLNIGYWLRNVKPMILNGILVLSLQDLNLYWLQSCQESVKNLTVFISCKINILSLTEMKQSCTMGSSITMEIYLNSSQQIIILFGPAGINELGNDNKDSRFHRLVEVLKLFLTQTSK